MPKRALTPHTDIESSQSSTASFNGSLSKFAFTASKPVSAPTASSSKPLRPIRAAALKKLLIPPPKSTIKQAKPEPVLAATAAPSDTDSSSTPVAKPAKKKKKKKHTGFAPPSTYAHLAPGIPDALGPNLLCLFVGTNPGLATVRSGHAYSAPSNGFWKLLHAGGLTPDRRVPPEQDLELPERYALGNTNIVARPTRDQAELSKAEMRAGVAPLEAKVRRWRPEAVCVVGKGIWESIYREKTGVALGAKRSGGFEFGWQHGWRLGEVEGVWEGARVFVSVSTSGLVAGYSPARKEEIFRELGVWVNGRRRERGDVVPRVLEEGVVAEAVRRRREEWEAGVVKWEKWIKVEDGVTTEVDTE
ncbi:G/U mismatch-specific uracil DNA glycosylase [Geopyxis carbonaria]|nr:G/U mismatch-specific uracil DNA glycosylase [Geopyxis carbonaria]